MEIEEFRLTRCTHRYVSFAAKPQPNRRMIGNTMTAARRRRKFSGWRWPCLAAAAVIAGWAPAASAATTEQLVVNHNSGLAINGFDPVAYFIDGGSLVGKEGIEHALSGAVWRFLNEGNRAAFIADPEVYMPRFGGYDPVGIARGVAVPGDPRLWLIAGERLYFFYSPQSREAFAVDPDSLSAAAERTWPAVQSTLAP
jgi:hypothetical protein